MKKLPVLFSLLLIAAMVLAACSTNENNQNENGTPGAAGTAVVGTPGAAVETAVGTPGAAVPGSTAGALTATVPPTGTVNPPATGTAVAGTPGAANTPGAVNGTPGAVVPVTGENQCAATRLSKLMDLKVRDKDNGEFGSVKGVVLLRDLVVPANAANNGAAAGTAVAGTPAAAGTAVAATPGAATPSAATPGAANPVLVQGKSTPPMIQYVIVDQEKEANGKSILVPFKAFNEKVFTQAPAQNECALTMNLTSSALAKAPVIDIANLPDMSAAGWDKEYNSFWANQGLTIPRTGSANGKTQTAFVMNGKFEDLKVVSPNGDDLGTVKDFIINPKDGSLKYAALATGGFLGLGEKYILVPTTQMAWVSEDASKPNDDGHLVMNLTKDSLKSVPTIDNLDKIDTTTPGWDKQLQSFWSSQGMPGAVETPAVTPVSK